MSRAWVALSPLPSPSFSLAGHYLVTMLFARIAVLLLLHVAKFFCNACISISLVPPPKSIPITLTVGSRIQFKIPIPTTEKELFAENYLVFAIENQRLHKISYHYLQPQFGIEEYNLGMTIPKVDHIESMHYLRLRNTSDGALIFTQKIIINNADPGDKDSSMLIYKDDPVEHYSRHQQHLIYNPQYDQQIDK